MLLFRTKKEKETDSAVLMVEVSLEKLRQKDLEEKKNLNPEWLQHWEVTPRSSIEFNPLVKTN